jgi:hypothetical protein
LAEIEELRQLVGALSPAPLNAGQVEALQAQLTNATRQIQAQRYCVARVHLNSFRQLVENFRRAGLLADRQMSPLLQSLRLLEQSAPMPSGSPERYAPGVTGELRTLSRDGQEITFEVIDGLAIFQGDMILGYADEIEERLSGTPMLTTIDDEVIGAAGVCLHWPLLCGRWTNAVIGYDFANNTGNWGDDATNRMMRDRIHAALGEWERRTGIRFERRAGGERIVFRNSAGCSSWIGREELTGFGPQWVNVGTDCGLGTVIHEIGHAVGIYHEHSRNDRDGHVRVRFDRIPLDKAHNFYQYAFLGRDIGPYDFASIMHYPCNVRLGDTDIIGAIEPIEGDCTGIGQRSMLSEGDVLAAYWLYPPSFEITGAAPGETRDRFTLGVTFSTPPVHDDHIAWFTNRTIGVQSTGPTFSTMEAGLAPGTHIITATVLIWETIVVHRRITINIVNNPPVVSLGPDRDVDLNRRFNVWATVNDVEDGACPAGVCTYTWHPEPERDMGPAADFRFHEEGPHTITVTVRDGGGASTSASVTVNVVNSPPTVEMVLPVAGGTYAADSELRLQAVTRDLNEGPDPGGGPVGCQWTSSDPTDVFNTSNSCRPYLVFGDPGPRTITVTATDPQGLSAAASVSITVVDCGDVCPPTASFIIETTPELNGSLYNPPFTGPGFFLTTPIEFRGRVDSATLPSDSPIEFEWRMTPPCLSFLGCPDDRDVVLHSGTIEIHRFNWDAGRLTWTPRDHVAEWAACTSTALAHTITLWVRDSLGATSEFRQVVYLACVLH